MTKDFKDFKTEIMQRFDKIDKKNDYAIDMLFKYSDMLVETKTITKKNESDIIVLFSKIKTMPRTISVLLGIVLSVIAIFTFLTKNL